MNEKWGTLASLLVFLMISSSVILVQKDLLSDFLIGSAGKSKAKKIKRGATPWQRHVTMSYIRPHLVQDIKAFERYYRIYIIYLCSLLPQVILLFVLNLRMVRDVILLPNAILGLIFGIPSWPGAGKLSKYAQRNREKTGKKRK